MARDPWEAFVRDAAALRAEAERTSGITAEAPWETPDPAFGDLAFPCFSHARAARREPAAVAADLAAGMEPRGLVGGVSAAGGYVNFRADPRGLAAALLASWREYGAAYGSGERRTERVLVEHTSVNPTGPVHVGRARNPILGDSLARLLRLAGFAVTTEYFVNDVGRQVVIMAWGLRNLPPPPDAPAKEDHRLVLYYREASQRHEKDPATAAAISEMIRRFERGDEALTREIRSVAERGLSGIRQSLDALGVSVDRYFWESDLILAGRHTEVLERLRPHCGEEDGALFVDMAPHGITGKDTRVFFARKDGTSLYPTRDVAYHLDKLARCDVAINVLGEDHRLEFEQLKVALRLAGADRVPEALFYSFIGLPEGRMSTRKGVVVNLDDLLEEALERAGAVVAEKRPDLPEERRREIARSVAVGAVRYHLVRVQPEKKITFRWEEALSLEGSSAPFLQYAHARCRSILAKAGDVPGVGEVPPLEPAEAALAKALARYPSTVAAAAAARRPHRVAVYANDLVNAFNAFYRDCPVLEAPEGVRAWRLTLVAVTKSVLASALDILGVEAPEEM